MPSIYAHVRAPSTCNPATPPHTALGLWTALFLGGQRNNKKGKQRAHPAVGGLWDGNVGACLCLFVVYTYMYIYVCICDYNTVLSFTTHHTTHHPTALLNDVVAADSSEEDPTSNSSSSFDPTTPQHQPPHTVITSLPQSLAQWLGFPCALYLGIALFLLLVGLCLGEPEGRVAVGVLLAAVLRCVCLCVVWFIDLCV